MISDELSNVADALLTYAARGEATPPERMAQFAAIVLELSVRVAAMEDQPIPQFLRRLPGDPAEEVAMLVEKGWSLDDARAFVGEQEIGHE